MRKKLGMEPPENITPLKLDIVEQQRKYELITPLYGGGVSASETDSVTVVRATEIRGQLRFWWRAMRGGQSEGDPAMKIREDAIWGKAYEKGDTGIPSDQTVQIVVDVSQEGTAIKPFRMRGRTPEPINGVPGYVSFPLQPDQNERRNADPFIPDVRKGVQFTLTISYPARLIKEIEAALWAWETFGGLGARTRRGFGALHLREIDGVPYRFLPASRGIEQWIKNEARKHIKVGIFPPGVPHLSQDIQIVAACFHRDPVEAWKNLIKELQDFRLKKDDNRRSAWPEADTIRSIAAKGPAPDIKKFPRAAFGLPIIFHFTGKNAPAGNYTLNEANMERESGPDEAPPHKERFASPLILRPFQCSDSMAVGLALLLEGSRVDLKQLILQDENKGSQSVEGTLTAGEARKITKEISELNNETDVLQAFMKSLKGV